MTKVTDKMCGQSNGSRQSGGIPRKMDFIMSRVFALLMEALTSAMKSGAQTRTEGTEALLAHGHCKKLSFSPFCLNFSNFACFGYSLFLVCFLFCLDFGSF